MYVLKHQICVLHLFIYRWPPDLNQADHLVPGFTITKRYICAHRKHVCIPNWNTQRNIAIRVHWNAHLVLFHIVWATFSAFLFNVSFFFFYFHLLLSCRRLNNTQREQHNNNNKKGTRTMIWWWCNMLWVFRAPYQIKVTFMHGCDFLYLPELCIWHGFLPFVAWSRRCVVRSKPIGSFDNPLESLMTIMWNLICLKHSTIDCKWLQYQCITHVTVLARHINFMEENRNMKRTKIWYTERQEAWDTQHTWHISQSKEITTDLLHK